MVRLVGFDQPDADKSRTFQGLGKFNEAAVLLRLDGGKFNIAVKVVGCCVLEVTT